MGKHFVSAHVYEDGRIKLSKPNLQKKLEEGRVAAKKEKEVGEGKGEKVGEKEGPAEQTK